MKKRSGRKTSGAGKKKDEKILNTRRPFVLFVLSLFEHFKYL